MTGGPPFDDGALGDILGAAVGGKHVAVKNLQPVFGGNARKAWSFDAACADEPASQPMPCILLSQVPGRHVDSDIALEYRVLEAMNGSGIRAPRAIALDDRGRITGAPAIILERMPGRANAFEFLRPPDVETSRALTRELALVTADLHRFDWMAAGLHDLGDTSAGALVEQWEASYFRDRGSAVPALTYLYCWLKDHLPSSGRASLVHGDLRPGNFLYEGNRIAALLDWEMAHIGDPAEDIAWIYRAMWSPEAFVSLDEFIALYEDRAQVTVSRRNVAFFRIFGEVKFATLSLIASRSFASGKTRNFRHADRATKVAGSIESCLDWIEQDIWRGGHA